MKLNLLQKPYTMKSIKLKVLLGLTLAIFIIAGCEREQKFGIRSVAYSNIDDYNTEDISSNVLRVELGNSDNNISMILSITDQDGIPLENFTIGNIEIYQMLGEDSIEINIENMYELNKQGNPDPIAAAMTMDYSSSMNYENIISMENAVKTFVRLKEKEDMVEIIKFASFIETAQSLTSDTTLLIDAIERNPSVGGSTAFYSSCEEGITSVQSVQNVIPAVIALTDGDDNNSSISLYNLIELAQLSQVPVYTIDYGSAYISNNMVTLAEETGGRAFNSPDNNEILSLYELISGQLRNLYMVEWNGSYSTGSQIVIRVTVTYTAGNGTFTDTVEKLFVLTR